MTDWLKEEVVHRGTIITVKKATRLGPDGRIHDFDIVEHHGGVGVVPLLGDRVVLVRQPRPVVGQSLLEIPAGKLEGPDDDVVARAQAELGEEVGYRAGTDYQRRTGRAPDAGRGRLAGRRTARRAQDRHVRPDASAQHGAAGRIQPAGG